MLHLYKINKVELVNEPVDDILENEGRCLFDIFVKDIQYTEYFGTRDKMFEDEYEGGWPVIFKNNVLGFCENDYAEVDFNGTLHLNERSMDRHFFIRLDYNNKPKEGDYFCFLNQYDKRVTNEEIEELVNNNQFGDETDVTFEIGKDNKLHRVC